MYVNVCAFVFMSVCISVCICMCVCKNLHRYGELVFLNLILKIFKCMCVYLLVYMCTCVGASGGQKRVLDSLELVVMCYPMSVPVLGLEPRSFV